MPNTEGLLSCTFCGSGQKQVTHLIAGPHAYICDRCVSRAHVVMSGPGQTAATPIGALRHVSDEAATEPCSFCGKHRYQVAAMASAGHTQICNECVELCDEIISETGHGPRP